MNRLVIALALLLPLFHAGCSSSAPELVYDTAPTTLLGGHAAREGYSGPASVEYAEDLKARQEALLREGHALVNSGTLLIDKGDGLKEMTELGKQHRADVVLFTYVPIGEVDQVQWQKETRKSHISPTEAMVYYKRNAYNGGTLVEEINQPALKAHGRTLLRFALLRRTN